MKEEIGKLLDIIDTLLGPKGCPWDRKQTLLSMREAIVEEAYELVEAIDLDDNHKIKIELGDLFYGLLFLCRLAEKESRFSALDVPVEASNKLVRRHPHVFGDSVVNNSDEVIERWDEIKATEKEHLDRRSLLDRIPKNMPALIRSQEIVKSINKYCDKHSVVASCKTEEQLGYALWSLVEEAQAAGVDAEGALRKVASLKEKDFRQKEQGFI